MGAERIETFKNRLCEAMRIRDIKAAELARKTGYKEANISQWVNGKYEAKQKGVYKLATSLNVNEAWLMGYDVPMERDALKPTEQFDEWDSKFNLNGKLAKGVEIIEKVLTKLPIYDSPVSAGSGAWIGEGHEYELATFEDVPPQADFALRVRGNSMTPMYNDDDIVFVKAGVLVESGQIGVYVLNGEGYLKMLQGNKLVSLNSEYKPIVIKEWDSFFCAGRVIGKTTLKD